MHTISGRNCGRGLRGFTLIELMVVTAIIAVLAALSISVAAKVQTKSRQVRELNAARQIIAAYLAYPQDHDGDLPRGYDKTAGAVTLQSGQQIVGEPTCRYPWRIAPYLQEQAEEIFLLNDNKKFTDGLAKDSFEYQYRVSLHPALGVNGYCLGGYYDGTNSGNFQQDVVRRSAQAVRPSSLIVFASARLKQSGADEEVAGHFLITPPKFWRTKWAAQYDPSGPSSSFGNVALRWEDKATCAFLDGSVRLLDETELRDMRHWSNTAVDQDDPNFTVPR